MFIYPIGTTDACTHAATLLRRSGIPVIDHPSPDITHLLLDVPSFLGDGSLRGGGRIEPVLRMLPETVCIIGGNLDVSSIKQYSKMDLLRNTGYVASNAAITADCAIRLAGTYMCKTFFDSPALVIGWGRIGKVLAKMLRDLGCAVTVAARKETDRAMLRALGYPTVSMEQIPGMIPAFSLVFNTVPAPVLEISLPYGCIALDLASQPGILADNVISAKGLPGKMASISSGKLIAETILGLIQEGSL